MPDEMRTKEEVLGRLTFLENTLANDPGAQREINLIKWILKMGPEHIHVPKAGGQK